MIQAPSRHERTIKLQVLPAGMLKLEYVTRNQKLETINPNLDKPEPKGTGGQRANGKGQKSK